MTDTESKLRQRTDGRLDRSRDPAILNAAVAALTEHGYHATNMNDIAARAGVGKAAIYRRWSSKAALITDALVYWRPDLMSDDIPDTGSLTDDFDALVERAARNDDNLISHDLVLRVALEAAHDPELASALHDLMLHKGRREISAILERAAARGEISGDRDWSLIADALTAMGLMRVIGGQIVDAKFVRAVIDTLVLPAVRSPVSSTANTTESKLRQRTDGRLDRSRDPAILNAAVAALTEHGYHATNMNDIAARAGVGKAAIYRRWSSKAALITDALVYWRPDLMSDDIPDTGSLTDDFDALVERAARNDDNLISHDLVLRVALEAAHDPELASALHDLMLHKGRREISAILERAAARGEISGDRDWSLIADALTAMGLMRVIGGQIVDAKFVRAVIDTLVLPAVRSPVSSTANTIEGAQDA
jgi:AcrR family transcriptional regulator